MKRKKMILIAGLVTLFGLLVFGGGSESKAQMSPIMDLSNYKIQERIRSCGLIATKPIPAIGTIVGSPEARDNIAERDVVYIKLVPGNQVKPGDRFTIARWGREITHPITHKKIGNVVRVPGVLVVLEAQSGIVPAKMEKSFFPAVYGDLVIPPMPLPPKNLPVRFGNRITGTIVASPEEEENITERVVVFIDRGTQDGVIMGDIFYIYQDSYLIKGAEGSKNPPPLFRTGEGVVVSANVETSTLLVTKSVKAIYVGDTIISGKGK
jgi:hypothetical protein